MRVPPQYSVSTSVGKTERLGTKRVLLTAGSTAVLIAFSYRLSESKETDFFTIPANEKWKFEAPKGKKIWFVFHKVASGTSTLDVMATDGDFKKVA